MNQIIQQPAQPQSQPTQPPPVAAQQVPQGQIAEKKSGWLKWVIIVLAVLIVLGGLAWWIFA